MLELDTIYKEDCLIGMRKIPDKSIDLIVTDPPYIIEPDGGGGCFGRKNRCFHNQIADLKMGISNDFLDEMVRVCKAPNIYLFCSKDQLHQYISYSLQNGFRWDLLTWHKTNPVPTCNNKYLSDTEYIFFIHKGVKLGGDYSTKRKFWVTEVNKKDKELWKHPTIKPLNIIRTLVKNSSNETDVVLDPFVGSGTTAIACIKENRHFIGFEINKDYYLSAIKRIGFEKEQLVLF